MGRRRVDLWRWVVIVAAAASAIRPSEGSTIAPSPVSFGYPSLGASSPSQFWNDGSALEPQPDSLPKAFSPMYGALPPTIHPATPSVLSLAPLADAGTGDKWPRAIPPAVERQPDAPISSPPFLPSPKQSQPSLFNSSPPVAPRTDPNTAFAPRAVYFPGSATPPASVTSPVSSGKRNDLPVASPPIEGYSHLPPSNSSSTEGASPTVSPAPEKAQPANTSSQTGAPPRLSPMPEKSKPSNNSVSKGSSPMLSPVTEEPKSSNNSASEGSPPMLSPVPNKVKPSDSAHAPLASHLQPPVMSISDGPTTGSPVQRARKEVGNHSSPPSSRFAPPSHLLAPMVTPAPKHNLQHRASPPSDQGLSFPQVQPPAPSQPLPASSESNEWPSHSPTTTPASYVGVSSVVPSPPMWLLPPPPPNLDCKLLMCTEPLTNPPPGSPCVCVLPMRVGLRLSVTLYTFFPLVPDFAQEIAHGISMNQNQVRIMGANVANEEPENTVVLVDLVPDKEKFENYIALSTFNKFWLKDVIINRSLFGDYEVLYVVYPGLPPSPPRAPTDSNIGDGTFANNYNARAMKPLGVEISKPKRKANGNLIAVIALSSFFALMLCVGAAWYLLLKQTDRNHHARTNLQNLLPLFSNSSGIKHMQLGRLSSESASANSSIATHTGQAKIFTLAEIERTTNRFHETRIIGEGGFGRVYQGTLDDGVEVAVKVLKRDDQRGGREFFAEIEMLSRLHHRNLVKLIGICTEEHIRCLVYELVPNGSLESHLHGLDKETAPLDWSARLKIALGAARGLAYLHEDSSPRVIHRDFKSSNILLEHDYTPKVSDFGLARAAVDGGNLHISTQVMGTFGYVAPEYAMTGHFLVKSDVYSYGVVLLELLTGRKPIDMLQPPGQENLVSWARPLLINVDNLETIIEPALRANAPLDSVAKVAAIASMCVQPEVSHRPFMGEVVQALNLVCHECIESKGSGNSSREDSSAQNAAATVGNGLGLEAERVLLESYLLSESTRFDGDEFGSFRRHASSGPLTTSKSREYWQRLSSSTGSMSDS